MDARPLAPVSRATLEEMAAIPYKEIDISPGLELNKVSNAHRHHLYRTATKKTTIDTYTLQDKGAHYILDLHCQYPSLATIIGVNGSGDGQKAYELRFHRRAPATYGVDTVEFCKHITIGWKLERTYRLILDNDDMDVDESEELIGALVPKLEGSGRLAVERLQSLAVFDSFTGVRLASACMQFDRPAKHLEYVVLSPRQYERRKDLRDILRGFRYWTRDLRLHVESESNFQPICFDELFDPATCRKIALRHYEMFEITSWLADWNDSYTSHRKSRQYAKLTGDDIATWDDPASYGRIRSFTLVFEDLDEEHEDSDRFSPPYLTATIARIAPTLLILGGPMCTYSIRFTTDGSETAECMAKFMSDTVTAILRREIVDIISNVRSKRPVGWKRMEKPHEAKRGQSARSG